MSQLGVSVSTVQAPPTGVNPFNTASAFMIGLADAGPNPTTGPPAKLLSINDFPAVFGPRSSTNATLYDAVDAFFREAAPASPPCYVSRVLGSAPTFASVVLADATTGSPLTVTATSAGVAGNAITVSATNNTSTYTLTVTDPLGNVFTSPALADLASAVSWAATTGVVTITTGTGTLPKTQGPLTLSGGSDDRTHATLANWQTGLDALHHDYGPGQVLAPGQTNAGLSGIWSALAGHAQAKNRVAIGNLSDGQSAATLISNVNAVSLGSNAAYIGLWAGNLVIPGVVPGTTRSITPDSVIAALCARADATGNPNQAAAGEGFPLNYATAFTTIVSGGKSPYSDSDMSTVNDHGINTSKSKFGALENYGFVSLISPTVDGTYSQLSAVRLRMALQADFEFLAEPFVFSQNDGADSDTNKLNSVLQNNLKGYWGVGALFGATASDAFSIDTGPSVNTPAVVAAKQLKALVAVRISPFAQLVPITLATVPVSQTL